MKRLASQADLSPPPFAKRVKLVDPIDLMEIEDVFSQESVNSYSQDSVSENQIGIRKDMDYVNKRINRKVQKEQNKALKMMNNKNNPKLARICQIFNEVQKKSSTFGIDFSPPEIGVVGMQSDGKSTFVESLLGFKFNLISSQIGTRRPLILKMTNDLTKNIPECYFEDNLPKKLIPHTSLQNEIRRRTIEECGTTDVSPKPIVLHVRYKYCSNLLLYDFPGFRKKEDDEFGKAIEDMVMGVITRRKNMLILCLEQSTVEWVNTQVRPMIAKVDPEMKRTLFISTKFNNRINQFSDALEVNSFIEAGKKLSGGKVFYISLPAGFGVSNLDESDFKSKMIDVHMSDYKTLLKTGLNEKRHLQNIGFFRVEKYLQKDLYLRYINAIAPTYEVITHEIKKMTSRILQNQKYLNNVNAINISNVATQCVSKFVVLVTKALKGSNVFFHLKCGMTLQEEREKYTKKTKTNSNSNIPMWKNFCVKNVKINNEAFKLYGGSQITRLLNEFEVVALSMEFPPTTNDEVAVAIGLSNKHNYPNWEHAATDIVQKKYVEVFTPLIETLMKRTKFVVTEMIEMVYKHIRVKTTQNNHNEESFETEISTEHNLSNVQVLPFYEEFVHSTNIFVENIMKEMNSIVLSEMQYITSIVDWNLLSPRKREKEIEKEYNFLAPSKEDIITRVKKRTSGNVQSFWNITNKNGNNNNNNENVKRNPDLNDEICKKIKVVAARLFAGVRSVFVKFMKLKYVSKFVLPMQNDMEKYLRKHVQSISDVKLRDILFKGTEEKEKETKALLLKRKEMLLEVQKMERLKNLANEEIIKSKEEKKKKKSTHQDQDFM